MKIIAVAQVENSENLVKQIEKQTIAPEKTYIFTDPKPAKTINARRKRIADNHQKLVDLVKNVDCDLIWQLEQDVDLPEDCLERLLGRVIQMDSDLGYISGIQVGRHGLYCLGAWTNFTKDSFESLDYKLKGIQPVDATGFYCLLAPKKVWLKGKASWNGEPYGPDVVWSRSIPENKYVDMGISIGHIVKQGIIRPEHPSTCNARFYNTSEGWKYRQL